MVWTFIAWFLFFWILFLYIKKCWTSDDRIQDLEKEITNLKGERDRAIKRRDEESIVARQKIDRLYQQVQSLERDNKWLRDEHEAKEKLRNNTLADLFQLDNKLVYPKKGGR